MLKVKKYVAGTKIKEPGVYADLPIDLYHGDCCDGPSISSSGLRTIASKNKTPRHYYEKSYLNPNRVPEETKDYFSFGRAAHTLLLGERDFQKSYAVRPVEFKDWRTNAAKDWRAEQELAGKTVLVPDQLVAIQSLADNLAADPMVQQGLMQGLVEHSMLWRDPVTGIWLKSRPDIIPTADGVLVDIKTTMDASDEAIQTTVRKHGYAMQGALAGAGLKSLLNIEMTDFVLVWLEKERPFLINIQPVDNEWIFWARREQRGAIDTFARCVETGEWPGYEGGRTTFMPDWLRKRFEADDQNGLIPKETAA